MSHDYQDLEIPPFYPYYGTLAKSQNRPTANGLGNAVPSVDYAYEDALMQELQLPQNNHVLPRHHLVPTRTIFEEESQIPLASPMNVCEHPAYHTSVFRHLGASATSSGPPSDSFSASRRASESSATSASQRYGDRLGASYALPLGLQEQADNELIAAQYYQDPIPIQDESLSAQAHLLPYQEQLLRGLAPGSIPTPYNLTNEAPSVTDMSIKRQAWPSSEFNAPYVPVPDEGMRGIFSGFVEKRHRRGSSTTSKSLSNGTSRNLLPTLSSKTLTTKSLSPKAKPRERRRHTNDMPEPYSRVFNYPEHQVSSFVAYDESSPQFQFPPANLGGTTDDRLSGRSSFDQPISLPQPSTEPDVALPLERVKTAETALDKSSEDGLEKNSTGGIRIPRLRLKRPTAMACDIPGDISELTVSQIKAELKRRNLPALGKKLELQQRLEAVLRQ